MMYAPIDPSKIEFVQISPGLIVARHAVVAIRILNANQDPAHHYIEAYFLAGDGLRSVSSEYGVSDVPATTRRQLGVEFK